MKSLKFFEKFEIFFEISENSVKEFWNTYN